MISLKEIRTDIAVDHAVKRFVPFAQSLLKQGLTDIPSDQFQRGLSAVATLPSQYIGKKVLIDGTVTLTRMTNVENPLNIMTYIDVDGCEITVSITCRPDRYDAIIFSREPHNTIGTTYFRKFSQHGATWYPVVSPPSR